MKNTFIPLDIAFINEEGIIESIKELDPMNPIPVYPDGDIRYAVEVNRGWFAENDIKVGDIILEDTEETEIDLNEVKDKKGKGSGTKDACYHKVKSRYSVWPSAYASGALVKCRKVGAANWGNSRKEEVEYEINEKMTDREFIKTKNQMQPTANDGGSVSQEKQDAYVKEVNRRRVNTGPGTFKINYKTEKDYEKNRDKTMNDHYNWRETLDEKCWKGYEKKGMKTMFGKRYPNCVKKSKKKK